MRRRLKDSPAAGHARLKTGSLHDVAAVAGYVPDASGQLCVVVGFVNTDLVAHGKGRAVLDALVDWVARSGLSATSGTEMSLPASGVPDSSTASATHPIVNR
jgi:D-alanyl-D-alanine carboxypeptidase/D-alanyl-D-alanine-endopeptidase (penicillin-binding protein 4)